MDKGEIRRDIKQNAKFMLTGNYGATIGIMFIQLGVSFAVSMVVNAVSYGILGLSSWTDWIYYYASGYYDTEMLFLILLRMWGGIALSALLSAAVALFVTMPLTFGALDWYRELSIGNRRSVSTIFNYFGSGKLYARALKVSIEYGVKLFLWSLLCSSGFCFLLFGASFGLGLASDVRGTGGALTALLIFLIILLYVAYLLAVMMITIRYALVIYSSVRNKDWKNREVFRVSTRYMSGHYWETLAYELSFIGWYLLIFVTCGIILIYLEPYKSAADILYYNYLFESGRAGDGPQTAAFGVAPPSGASTAESWRADRPAADAYLPGADGGTAPVQESGRAPEEPQRGETPPPKGTDPYSGTPSARESAPGDELDREEAPDPDARDSSDTDN